MSVNSSAGTQYASQAPEFPRHVVTAVLVAHDGARWLPNALSGLVSQDRPVQDVIAADTGSADDSARLLAESLGDHRVLHLARRSGFGAAVDECVRAAEPLTEEHLPYLARRSSWDPATRTWNDDAYDEPDQPHGEPVQWLWLLHDDCEPAPDALLHLLRVADSSPSAAVIGPKLRSWYDRRQLLEVGFSIARSGRRWTGLERREQDQGQHDQVRQVLAVSSAGMLVRRDVWEDLGGFDRRLPLMRDDVDFCWRAQSAGHTVLVAPDAVLRHAEAASRERRPVDCAGRSAVDPHRVDKAGAVYTLLANTRGVLLPYVFARVVLGTVLRTLAYLVGKVPGQAVDEMTGLLSVLLRPGRLLSARRQRSRAVVPPSELRSLFPPPGATVRATVEQVVSNVSGRAAAEASSAGRHGGGLDSGPSGGDDDGEFLEVEQFALLKRIARQPAPMLFAVLLLFSLIACRALLGGGALAGGALLPAPADASDLWGSYLGAWHSLGVGSTETAPPYLAIVATLSSVLLGSSGLALTVLLVASVPLAGLSAYFASRPLVGSRLLRAWGAVAYAFLPAATGALAGGRLGTAVLAVLLPLMARAAVSAAGLRMSADAVDRGLRPGWRAAWAVALLLTITTAFTPIAWLIALVLVGAALATRVVRGQSRLLVPLALRAAAVLGAPMVVLAPWSLGLLTHPRRFLDEAGLPFGARSATATDLLLINPGGPGAAGGFLLAGIVLAALAALVRAERRSAIVTAWVGALTGLVFAVVANTTAWAGPATLVYGIALLAAAAVGAEGANERIAASGFGWRQPVAALVALAAVLAPLSAAVGWMAGGADGPLERRDPTQVPAFVAEESNTGDQARTLVVSGTPDHVSYALVRGAGTRLGDAEIAAASGADPRLDKIVGNLVAGSGADQASQLGGYAVRYVLVQSGAPRQVSRTLDSTPGLSRLSQADGSALWRVDDDVARVTIVQPSTGGEAGGSDDTGAKGGAGEDTAAGTETVASGKVEAHTTISTGPEGRVLRLADRAAPGWTATLDGRELTATTVDGWAQGFRLPSSGGRLDLVYDDPFTHTLWLWLQGFLGLVLVVMALPGRRREVDDDLPDTEAEPVPAAAGIPAQGGDGRRARRLRAAADAEPEAQGAGQGAAHGDGEEEAYDAPAASRADGTSHQEQAEYAQYAEYDPYAAGPREDDPYGQEQWAADYRSDYGYEQPAAQPQEQAYDPYGYGRQAPQPGHDRQGYDSQGYEQQGYEQQGYEQQPQGYDASYAPYGNHDTDTYGTDAYGTDGYRRDGSNQ
ncbi:glycosyltransferase [Actinacidiphila sp. bgisy167]|uniref:glycosyltransferase n=1 Tax=Actinacidiphila sp. bgisy167 TaxID=3413797 RepID=UPI003D72ACD3